MINEMQENVDWERGKKGRLQFFQLAAPIPEGGQRADAGRIILPAHPILSLALRRNPCMERCLIK